MYGVVIAKPSPHSLFSCVKIPVMRVTCSHFGVVKWGDAQLPHIGVCLKVWSNSPPNPMVNHHVPPENNHLEASNIFKTSLQYPIGIIRCHQRHRVFLCVPGVPVDGSPLRTLAKEMAISEMNTIFLNIVKPSSPFRILTNSSYWGFAHACTVVQKSHGTSKKSDLGLPSYRYFTGPSYPPVIQYGSFRSMFLPTQSHRLAMGRSKCTSSMVFEGS